MQRALDFCSCSPSYLQLVRTDSQERTNWENDGDKWSVLKQINNILIYLIDLSICKMDIII